MADKTIPISELPSSGSNTVGLYTIGVNASNESVKVPLGDILASAHGEVMFADLDKLCTADDMLQGKPACYTVLDTLVTTKGTVTVKVGVLWVYSDNLRHVVMQVLNTNFVLDDDGTITGKVHNHDVHEYSRTYAYSTAAGTLHTWSKWQEVGGKGIVDRITNVALAKQNKLTAGDDATRLNGAKLSTKQIFTGSIDTTAGAVPMLLPVGGCIYNSADKKLYIGDSNSQPVEVAKPNDFLFFSNGKLYHYQFGNFGEVETGTTLVAGDGATRINASALSTKQIYRGTVINNADVVPTLALGAYCFNTATKKLYVGAQHGNAMVTDTVPMPDDFLFVDTASGTTYRCDGTTLHNIANIKTINGQSLLGGGNVQLTGADFLLEQGAGLTINEAVNSNTEELQNKLDKAVFDSFDKHPATYFNGFVRDIDAARYPKSCPFGLKQFSVVFDRRYTSDAITNEGYKVFELNGANAANDYLYLRINGWQIDFHARKSGGTAYNSKYLGSLSSQGTDHVIFTFNLETGEIKAYYSGELAWTDQLNDWDFDTYYPSNCKTYSLNPAVVSGKLGCAMLSYCISDDDAAKLYQAGCYFDNFMPAPYICYDKDVRKMTSYDKIGDLYSNSITLVAENGAIRINCSKSNNNEYLTYDNFIPSRDTVKMMRYTAHIKVISGDSFRFNGFGIHGAFVAKIYNSSDGSLYCEGAAKALLAGHEYDMVFIGVPNSAGSYLLKFSHGDSGVCEVSDITVTNLGAFLLCAPQNYVGSSFLQGSGETLNLNGGEALYDLYKPRIVSTKGYPQFNGQLCITPADGKVYIAVRTAKGYTWKQINNT